MRKNLAQRQDSMRERSLKPELRKPVQSVRECNPVDYSRPVEYLATRDVQLLTYWPKAGGVYLLCEDGRYYIGQSVDVPARYASHRLKPIGCGFQDPRCVMLAVVRDRPEWSWSQNNHVRLNAEARFLAAALRMGITLTNANLTPLKRERLAKLFRDVTAERERLERAIKILC
jgi:hypothetical protein